VGRKAHDSSGRDVKFVGSESLHCRSLGCPGFPVGVGDAAIFMRFSLQKTADAGLPSAACRKSGCARDDKGEGSASIWRDGHTDNLTGVVHFSLNLPQASPAARDDKGRGRFHGERSLERRCFYLHLPPDQPADPTKALASLTYLISKTVLTPMSSHIRLVEIRIPFSSGSNGVHICLLESRVYWGCECPRESGPRFSIGPRRAL
jgi:hypothetical protein